MKIRNSIASMGWRVVLVELVVIIFVSCGQKQKEGSEEKAAKTGMSIPDTLKWSERMALSIMKRNPEAWQVDDSAKPKWNYKTGLVMFAFEKLYNATNNEKYFNYEKGYTDKFIDSAGTIATYKLTNYNIDNINSGKILFELYYNTKDERYLTALQTLRKQLEGQPRTPSGGFWHKKIYPDQMWLDGLYMGEPFYAYYTVKYEEGKNLDDVALQFQLVHDHTYDPKTGLYFHAWDESKKMEWANKETGAAPNIWLRALGWYSMALVDALDYFPQDHPKRSQLIGYLNELSEAIVKYQDKSGLWYQVPNMQDKEGNYLEASGSAMLAYSLAKGVNKGYLPESYQKAAEDAFNGLITQLIVVEPDGELHLNQICKSAGLGGNPYRDGSFEYYVNEPIVSDNAHGLGPFILAALQLNK
ncbi:MAG: glycoside hydrolase family 88 protein [Cyclobacteriaceae bacterium]|nr:glycoside hydrolase family 88 protein [Cyclobacteriaceae bacterium]